MNVFLEDTEQELDFGAKFWKISIIRDRFLMSISNIEFRQLYVYILIV